MNASAPGERISSSSAFTGAVTSALVRGVAIIVSSLSMRLLRRRGLRYWRASPVPFVTAVPPCDSVWRRRERSHRFRGSEAAPADGKREQVHAEIHGLLRVAHLPQARGTAGR